MRLKWDLNVSWAYNEGYICTNKLVKDMELSTVSPLPIVVLALFLSFFYPMTWFYRMPPGCHRTTPAYNSLNADTVSGEFRCMEAISVVSVCCRDIRTLRWLLVYLYTEATTMKIIYCGVGIDYREIKDYQL